MRFEYWQSSDGTWHWQLKSAVGETLAVGTPAVTREMCLTTIKLVKLAASAACNEVSALAATWSAAPLHDSSLPA